MNNLPALIQSEVLSSVAAISGSLLPAITCHDDYQTAAERSKQAKVFAKELEAKRKELTQPLDDEKKQIMEAFRPLTEALTACETHHRGLMRQWDAEQERIRREQQLELERKLRAAAQAEAEARALEAIKRGNEAKAEAILEAAETAPVAVPQLAEAKPLPGSGVHYRSKWCFRVTDENQVPRQFLCVDERKLREFVLLNQGRDAVPGVEVFEEKIQVLK